MENYYFFDVATGETVMIEAESHPDAIDIAYDTLQEPEFLYVMENKEA